METQIRRARSHHAHSSNTKRPIILTSHDALLINLRNPQNPTTALVFTSHTDTRWTRRNGDYPWRMDRRCMASTIIQQKLHQKKETNALHLDTVGNSLSPWLRALCDLVHKSYTLNVRSLG